jgi:ABC-type nitrate/sulfonate/bicarbonate transport system ATPase subunit
LVFLLRVLSGPIYLYDEPSIQDGAAETRNPQGYLIIIFPGAKIGVLGLNGAGKSTLLRIMAGVDKDFSGEARAQPGIKIGYLEQEPHSILIRMCVATWKMAYVKR